MFLIQIITVKRKLYNLVLVNSKKGEVRKKDFLFQNQKRIGKKKFFCEIDSRTKKNVPRDIFGASDY